MPTIDSLSKGSSKKFKPSVYRPWNYMDEIEKEELEKTLEKDSLVEEIDKRIQPQNTNISKCPPSDVKQKDNILESNLELSGGQSVDKPLEQENSLDLIYKLTGKQKELFFFIIECCLTRGTLSTGFISSEALVDAVKTTMRTIKKIIVRVINKGLIVRERGKRGRGGSYCFSIRHEIRSSALDYKRVTNTYSGISVESIRNHQGTVNALSEDLISAKELPSEWESLDIEPIRDIGFSKSHLVQLSRIKELNPVAVQDSINFFAFDLIRNDKAKNLKKSPLEFFIGILRQGHPYTAPANYVDPYVEAMNSYLQTQEKWQKQKDELESKLQDIEFQNWHDKLSDPEINALIPDNIKTDTLSQKTKKTLTNNHFRKHFKENVWPSIRRQVLASTPNWANQIRKNEVTQ